MSTVITIPLYPVANSTLDSPRKNNPEGNCSFEQSEDGDSEDLQEMNNSWGICISFMTMLAVTAPTLLETHHCQWLLAAGDETQNSTFLPSIVESDTEHDKLIYRYQNVNNWGLPNNEQCVSNSEVVRSILTLGGDVMCWITNEEWPEKYAQ